MNMCKFEYPATSPTSTVTVTSTAPALPLDVSPVVNQTRVESKSGVVQVVEHGDARDQIIVTLPHMSSTDYDALRSFFITDTQYLMKTFKFTYLPDHTNTESWTVRLSGPPQYLRIRGDQYVVTITMIEEVS